MIDFFSLASIVLTFFIVAVSPGPATLSNAIVAMQNGRREGLIYGVGLSCGLAFWGLVAASGMGVVLQSSVYLILETNFTGFKLLVDSIFKEAWGSPANQKYYYETDS